MAAARRSRPQPPLGGSTLPCHASRALTAAARRHAVSSGCWRKRSAPGGHPGSCCCGRPVLWPPMRPPATPMSPPQPLHASVQHQGYRFRRPARACTHQRKALQSRRRPRALGESCIVSASSDACPRHCWPPAHCKCLPPSSPLRPGGLGPPAHALDSSRQLDYAATAACGGPSRSQAFWAPQPRRPAGAEPAPAAPQGPAAWMSTPGR